MDGDKSAELLTEASKEAIKQAFETAKEFIGKLINPALDEGGGLVRDTIKFWRFKNKINIILKSKKFLEDKGINPVKILPKTLVSILENGSLEEDENTQDRWAALLANAADPEKRYSVKPSFAEILKELSPLEVMLLDRIFDEVNRNKSGKKLEIFFDKEKMCQNFQIDIDEFDVIADNLFRLNLCQPPASVGGVMIGEYPIQLRTYKLIGLTRLGYEFVKSCRFK